MRGRRRGVTLSARAMSELKSRREILGISQRAMARELGISQAQLWRLEERQNEATVVRLAEMASVLGLELSVGLHELGDPIRDAGHHALAKRFDAIPAPPWRSMAEMLLPNVGDRRSWDRVLRLIAEQSQVVGVELETRIRDIQAMVRKVRERERDGGVDEILIVLSNSATNRGLVSDLRTALADGYKSEPRDILNALRAGRRLPGSGVVLL